MLMSTYDPGYGYGFGDAPSLLQLIEASQIAATHGGYEFGAAFTDDYAAFIAGGTSATFKDAADIVYCSKDRANRPQCVLNAFTGSKARSGPIAEMQRAIDDLVNKSTDLLAGRELKGPVPQADGTTTDQSFRIENIRNPILRGPGYDGIVGDSTLRYGVYAITIAGLLKKTPNAATSLAFVSITRSDIWAKYAREIAAYLNDVTNNFQSLHNAFLARGNQAAQTQLDAKTIPYVVPLVTTKKSNKGLIIGTAATMLGLTAVAAVSAAKKKPAALYEEAYRPAFGRGRRRAYRD